MKSTFLLSFGGLIGASAVCVAQGVFGTILLNNYDSGKRIFLGSFCTPAPAGTIVEILGGPVGGSLTPVATATGVNRYTITPADISANGPGTGSFFDYGFGFVNGVAALAMGSFTLRAWTGAATYDAATIRGSISWTQATGSNPTPPNLPAPAVLAIPTVLATLSPITLTITQQPQ